MGRVTLDGPIGSLTRCIPSSRHRWLARLDTTRHRDRFQMGRQTSTEKKRGRPRKQATSRDVKYLAAGDALAATHQGNDSEAEQHERAWLRDNLEVVVDDVLRPGRGGE